MAADTAIAPLPQPLDQAAILAAAKGQVNTELQGQIDPLQNQIGTLGGQQTRVIGDIGAMFDHIQPTVDKSAAAVTDSYQGAQDAQHQIFSAATIAMNKMKQDRAQQAQQLAQQMGGPVAVGEFTAGFDPASEALANLGAGSQLHTLGYAQAGEQQAQAFAGQVFPLVRTEQTAQARQYYEDQIKSTQAKIDDLNSQRGALVNTRLNDLTKQNLDYQLQQHQQALDKLNADRTFGLQTRQAKADSLKAGHDWQATLTTLKHDEERIALAKRQFELSQGKLTGTYKGLPTIDKQNLDAQDKRSMALLNLSAEQLTLRKQQLATSESLAKKQFAANQQVTWNSYVDAAVNPHPGKSVQQSHAVEIQYTQALKDPKNSWYDSKTGKYYHAVTTHEVITTQPITDPKGLYEFLLSHNVPKNVALSKVRTRLAVPDWSPGQKTSKTKVS